MKFGSVLFGAPFSEM